MGSSQRLAAVAAISHAKHYYNHTQPDVVQTQTTHYNINIFFVSATLCGVLVAVCATCCRRSPAADKPDDVAARAAPAVYTVSADGRLAQVAAEVAGPPPAYETVVVGVPQKNPHPLQEVVTEPCAPDPPRCDSGLPSYEAAVMLRDTKL